MNRWEYSEPALEEEKTMAEEEKRGKDDDDDGFGRKRKRAFLGRVFRGEGDLLQF